VRARQSGGGASEPEPVDTTTDSAGATRDTPPPTQRLRPPGLLELEGLLADHLSTSVAVSMGAKRGKIVIDFADLEDLERLYYLMNPTEPGQTTT
jgi:ParB family chromosome partitioning protein